MPYSNLPKSKWPAMEKCTAALKKEGKTGDSIYAICYTQVMKEDVKEFVDDFLSEDGVDEMTTSGAIAVVPMGLLNTKKSDQTPKDPPDSTESEPDRVGKISGKVSS